MYMIVHQGQTGLEYYLKNLLLEFKTIYFFRIKDVVCKQQQQHAFVSLLFEGSDFSTQSLPQIFAEEKKSEKTTQMHLCYRKFIYQEARQETHSDQLQKKKKTKSISNEAPLGIFLTCRVIDTQVWSDQNLQKT